MGHKRAALARVRKAAGYTQEDLATALSVERSTIGRWELGATEPQPYLRPKLARLLSISPDELEDLLSPATATVTARQSPPAAPVRTETEGDDLDALTTTAAQESMRFLRQMTQDRASSDLLDHLRWEISRLAVDYVHTPVRVLFRDLVEARDAIFELLDRRQQTQHLWDLYFLGGAACVLLAHASQNSGNLRPAVKQLRTAWACADMVDHNPLRAWVRGTAALIDEWSLHQSQAVESARQASRFPASGESHMRLVAIEARSAARMGDRPRSCEALERVRSLQEAASGNDSDEVVELGGLLSFPRAKQHYYIGSTYGLLGEHEAAEQHAQAAITMYENGPAEQRSYGDEALAHLDIVNARLSTRDLDGAAAALAPVLALPGNHRIRQLGTALKRTRTLLNTPQLARNSVCQDLLNQLSDYGTHAAATNTR